jgi:hypothetical protein
VSKNSLHRAKTPKYAKVINYNIRKSAKNANYNTIKYAKIVNCNILKYAHGLTKTLSFGTIDL